MPAILGDRIFESPPLLAVLSAGTTSMIAGDVGVRGGRAGGLRRLLSWARSPDTNSHLVERSVVRLPHLPPAPPLFGTFFGTAAIEQGIRFCLDRVHTKGV